MKRKTPTNKQPVSARRPSPRSVQRLVSHSLEILESWHGFDGDDEIEEIRAMLKQAISMMCDPPGAVIAARDAEWAAALAPLTGSHSMSPETAAARVGITLEKAAGGK